MTKIQHKRTAVASMFQNGISRNTKCAVRNSFHRDMYVNICVKAHMLTHMLKVVCNEKMTWAYIVA